jgi:hypothetical protein
MARPRRGPEPDKRVTGHIDGEVYFADRPQRKPRTCVLNGHTFMLAGVERIEREGEIRGRQFLELSTCRRARTCRLLATQAKGGKSARFCRSKSVVEASIFGEVFRSDRLLAAPRSTPRHSRTERSDQRY